MKIRTVCWSLFTIATMQALPVAVRAVDHTGDFEIGPSVSPAEPGDLIASGSGYFDGGILGIGVASGFPYDPGVGIYYAEYLSEAWIEILAAQPDATYSWFQDLGDIKMDLDEDNILRLYNSSAAAKVVIDPNTPSITVDGRALLQLNSSGRLGLGTSSPNEQLEITGNFRIPATSGSSAGVIYQGSDRFLHSYGTDGVFLGKNSGNFTLTGTHNVAVGAGTLDELTSGSANVAIGHQVLGKATSGAGNVGIGNLALQDVTTGTTNVGIGAEALRYTTTTWNAVAVGTYALRAYNQGHGTAVGYAAGFNATTAFGPTFLGYSSGSAVTDGSMNTALGWQALYEDGAGSTSTNGSYRTAVGAGAQVTANNTMALGGVGDYAANVIIGGTAASAKLHVVKTTEQVRVGYDGSNYYSTTVGSAGGVTFNATGSGAGFTFSDDVEVSTDLGVTGDATVDGTLRVQERGDLSMGSFTATP